VLFEAKEITDPIKLSLCLNSVVCTRRFDDFFCCFQLQNFSFFFTQNYFFFDLSSSIAYNYSQVKVPSIWVTEAAELAGATAELRWLLLSRVIISSSMGKFSGNEFII